MKIFKRIILVLLCFILIIVIGGFSYFKLTNYKATDEAKEVYKSSNKEENKDYIYFKAENSKDKAIIFYQGGNVDERAYSLLANDFNKQGIDFIVIKSFLDFSIFNPSKASNIIKKYPSKKWYISGHSLGGAVASMEASNFEGIIYLAAYPIKDLSTTTTKSLVLTGSNDGLVTEEKLLKKQILFSKNTKFVTIEGGNHAQMGNYGKQKKDNDATISDFDQRKIIIEESIKFMK